VFCRFVCMKSSVRISSRAPPIFAQVLRPFTQHLEENFGTQSLLSHSRVLPNPFRCIVLQLSYHYTLCTPTTKSVAKGMCAFAQLVSVTVYQTSVSTNVTQARRCDALSDLTANGLQKYFTATRHRNVFHLVHPGVTYARLIGQQVSAPCGGGLEYLHRSPASSKRRRKGTQCPGV
jgi:hypothetical protein